MVLQNRVKVSWLWILLCFTKKVGAKESSILFSKSPYHGTSMLHPFSSNLQCATTLNLSDLRKNTRFLQDLPQDSSWYQVIASHKSTKKVKNNSSCSQAFSNNCLATKIMLQQPYLFENHTVILVICFPQYVGWIS